ncbi:MAG: hypothetical protein PGN24_03680 [Microbacterium arborescens]
MSDSKTLEAMLRELQEISLFMGDLNEIRNGNYDPPRGADPDKRNRFNPARTTDDVVRVLKALHEESIRQTELLEAIAAAVTGEEVESDG